EAGVVVGTVSSATGGGALVGCRVLLGTDVESETGQAGSYVAALPDLVSEGRNSLEVACGDYDPHVEMITLRPGDTTHVDVVLRNDETAVEEALPGDGLFASSSASLRAEAVEP